jgi:hypothetical protein
LLAKRPLVAKLAAPPGNAATTVVEDPRRIMLLLTTGSTRARNRDGSTRAVGPEYRAHSIQVLSYRDYFNQYRQHPESKAHDPTDGKRCHPWTRGQLQPWHITATERVRVGKESNRLTDTHQPVDD